MKARAYWTATAIIGFELITGGVTDLVHGRTVLVVGDPVVGVLDHLRYPTYLLTILGVSKLLGAGAILAPGLPRLKEWAYAGTCFELVGAAASGLAVGDGLASQATPLVFAAFAVASWALRPPSRTLGALWLPLPCRLRTDVYDAGRGQPIPEALGDRGESRAQDRGRGARAGTPRP